MAQETAEIQGRTVIRPWRVGVLVDTTSPAQVRTAIANLSGVWGGVYMPILNVAAPVEELRLYGRRFDVDSLYSDIADGPISELLARPGWGWRGRGPWGPFGEEGHLRTGLLPIHALIEESTDLFQPTWDRDDPADLAFSAMWGLADDVHVSLSPTLDVVGPRQGPIPEALQAAGAGTLFGALDATSLHLRPHPRAYLDDDVGLYVIRADHPADVVDFWNMRIYGTRIIGLPADGADTVLTSLLSTRLPAIELRRSPGGAVTDDVVRVWGFQDASASTSAAIQAAADRDGLRVWPEERGAWPGYLFQGLRSRFTRSLRVDFRPSAHSVDIPLPVLPVRDDPEAFARGVVAAEVRLHRVVGQDPRMTASIPPHRQHASLLRHVGADGVDQVRVTEEGIALGVDAESDHVRVPFAYNQDVMRLLFDDPDVSVTQSDAGRFQTRAAEKFGGPFSGLFNQPGVRAAVTLAADRPAGVTLPHLREVVARDHGAWPDPLFGPKITARDYARQQVNFLLNSGIFVPTLKVHCSYCRVESHVSADDLAATMTCEFCGQTFSLALSHSLAQPEWHYRLAAHLGAAHVQALLPALAVTSLLRQLRHLEEPPLTHVLGLEVTTAGRKVEVDIAAYIRDREWAVVLGEVKTGNRIDANDIANLEFLQRRLTTAGVRCVLLFATLKEAFSPEEVADLRALAKRAGHVELSTGGSCANLPLVLTGPDLSHPPGSREHPWRWEPKTYTGIFGTARGSCARNLGLRDHELDVPRDNEPSHAHPAGARRAE